MAGVTTDGILLKDSLDLSGIVSKSGSQQIDGTKHLQAMNIDSGGAIFTIESGGVGNRRCPTTRILLINYMLILLQ